MEESTTLQASEARTPWPTGRSIGALASRKPEHFLRLMIKEQAFSNKKLFKFRKINLI